MTLEINNPSVEEAVDTFVELIFDESQPTTKSKEDSHESPLPF